MAGMKKKVNVIIKNKIDNESSKRYQPSLLLWNCKLEYSVYCATLLLLLLLFIYCSLLFVPETQHFGHPPNLIICLLYVI